MKTLQKYTNIALFLISATAIFPTHANTTVNEQEQVTQEEVIVESAKTTNRILEYTKINKAMLKRIAASYACLGSSILTTLAANKYNLYNDYPIVNLILLQWIVAASLFIDSILVSGPERSEK